MAAGESVLGRGRFTIDTAGYRTMLEYLRASPTRVWAIAGCNGIGRHIADRLIADGEQAVDVPPKQRRATTARWRGGNRASARLSSTLEVVRPTAGLATSSLTVFRRCLRKCDKQTFIKVRRA